jgi:hypothetical protein
MDFGDHLVDYCSFTIDQTGPDALVLGLGTRRLVMVGLGMDAEQAFHDLLGGKNPWGEEPIREVLYRMSGVDLTSIDAIGVETVQVVLSE